MTFRRRTSGTKSKRHFGLNVIEKTASDRKPFVVCFMTTTTVSSVRTRAPVIENGSRASREHNVKLILLLSHYTLGTRTTTTASSSSFAHIPTVRGNRFQLASSAKSGLPEESFVCSSLESQPEKYRMITLDLAPTLSHTSADQATTTMGLNPFVS